MAIKSVFFFALSNIANSKFLIIKILWKRERERERERMAVITELGEGESAGLGLGHNSDVCIFLR